MLARMPLSAEFPEFAARAFVEAINHRSVDELAGLMTDDHVFIDCLGKRLESREKLMAAWEVYFQAVPDFEMVVDETYVAGNVVVLLGHAHGTYATEGRLLPENEWKTPVIWRARIRWGLVAEWSVCGSNDPLRHLMDKHQA